jgi:hypothetical protein
MKLFSMRQSGKESLSPSSVGKFKPDPYSYEHKITLDDAALTKLGMDTPKVGDVFHVMAHGHVTSVSQDESQNGGKSRHVSLQLKKMGTQKAPKGGSALDAVNSGIKSAQED